MVLGGGAYFAVSPNPERPFVVRTAAGATGSTARGLVGAVGLLASGKRE